MLAIYIHRDVVLYLGKGCFGVVTLSVGRLQWWLKIKIPHMGVCLVENYAFCKFGHGIEIAD